MHQAFAALAEPNRIRIVELLRGGPRPVTHICRRLRLAQPQVSKHLKVLREARLVEMRPHAQQRLYALHGPGLRAVHGWLEGYRSLWEERFGQLDELVASLKANQQEPRP